MLISLDELIKSITVSLDMVEGELLGATTHHGKRVAVLAAAMGSRFGMEKEELLALAVCALFHDSALTEYILAEHDGKAHDPSMKLHCEYGQRNAESLMLKTDIGGFVQYHHERADGRGPYGKTDGQFPLGAELIGIADSLDVINHLQRRRPEDLPSLRAFISKRTGTVYTKRAAEAMLDVLDEDMLFFLKDDSIFETAARYIPSWKMDIEDRVIFSLAELVSRIIDDKSSFTRTHSAQIANKAWLMGGFYGYMSSLRAQIFLAAALHDIGKLSTPLEILEKPGRLTEAEFLVIKRHVRITYELLKDIGGFEEICGWASNHHEKLDGTGYPFGKRAEKLDFISRLIACIDIYQAVSEKRPYHDSCGHRKAMGVLYEMAGGGVIDAGVVKDLDEALADYDGREVPPPECLIRQGEYGVL
jgi:HD-GYP domain-containing protein (c-di-GMP phosphodiesterase class II)